MKEVMHVPAMNKDGTDVFVPIMINRGKPNPEKTIAVMAFLADLEAVLIKHNASLNGFYDGGVSFRFNEDTLYPVSGVELDNDQNIIVQYSRKG